MIKVSKYGLIAIALNLSIYAQAQDNEPADQSANQSASHRKNQSYNVILYDAETIARINSEPSLLPSSPYPKDISSQYTEYFLGIPVMLNPPTCSPSALAVRVHVKNVVKAKGFIVADLHNEIAEDFLNPEKVVLRVRASAIKGVTSFCMPLTQPGKYAVVVYHDKNDNRKFDKGFLRIPKERFGMSRNPKFRLQTPAFEEVVFDVNEAGTNIIIKLAKSSDVLKGRKQ